MQCSRTVLHAHRVLIYTVYTTIHIHQYTHTGTYSMYVPGSRQHNHCIFALLGYRFGHLL
jgi:hypothetical protein